MTPLRIALIGERGSGKDAAAHYLTQHGCKQLSIAAPIKAAVYAAFEARGIDTSNKGEMRAPLQQAGLAARAIDGSLWVRSLIYRHELESPHGNGYVVTDIRYPNEADMLRRVGFSIVRIEAPEEMRRARCIDRGDGSFREEDALHPSEVEQRSIEADFLVRTDSDLETFYATLGAIVVAITSPSDEYNHA